MSQVDLTSQDMLKLSDCTELMDRQWAPCRYHCPVHADVRGYIEHVAGGRFRDAVDLIRQKLPYATVCGRICHHPCEANCRRESVDEAVAIREVKRFVAELQGVDGATVHKAASQDKARVAVVGSGPAGLSAALDLAKLGYRPTVFEKFDVAGGVPATAIPSYRLPDDVIKIDVDWIAAHGVEIVTGVQIGKDKTLDDLRSEGFEAVIVAAGLAAGRMLPLPGADSPRVLEAMSFLTAARFGESIDLGKNVVVIGGGNVAMDVARTAVRLGAQAVTAMCLEDEQEIPAFSWEIEEAIEEGVQITHRRGPVEVLREGEAVTGLKTRKVTRVFDGEGNFSPEYDDADIIDIECDTVILAIGQMADMNFTEGSSLEVTDRGRLTFDPATHQTNIENVFACGEIVTPPGSAVEACASGQRAAVAVDLFLSGKAVELNESLGEAIGEIPCKTAELVRKVARCTVEAPSGAERAKNFEQIDSNLAEAVAMAEARRCMGCGGGAEVLVDKCVACLTCLRVCPFDIPKITDVARIDSALCQACGMCVGDCPGNAIILRSRDARCIQTHTADVLAEGNAKVIAYVCGHNASADELKAPSTTEGVSEIYMPSMSQLSAVDILHAFLSGATGVIVIALPDAAERYPGTTARVAKRAGQASELLAEIGISKDKVQFVELEQVDRKTITDSIAAAAETIQSA